MTAPDPVDPRLVELVGRRIVRAEGGRPPVIGIAGAQGSGKTTLARTAAQAFGAAHISLDDVYLTKSRREQMAEDVHPLFQTRGPPGTHDLKMLNRLIKTLSLARTNDKTLLPGFDKREDDRRPIRDWRIFFGRPSAILIDGWCLGATAESPEALMTPVNALERERDPDAAWRTAVSNQVAGAYTELSGKMDATLFLRAPSFDVVHGWRCQQEADMLGVPPRALPAKERARLAEFIMYFERLTRSMINGGVRADVTVHLDRTRRVTEVA